MSLSELDAKLISSNPFWNFDVKYYEGDCYDRDVIFSALETIPEQVSDDDIAEAMEMISSWRKCLTKDRAKLAAILRSRSKK